MSYITLQEAQDMIADYQSTRPNMLAEGYDTSVLPLSITLPKDEIISCLNQTGCESLRIYLGVERDSDDQPLITTILVAVNQNDTDILPTQNYIIVDRGARCPSNCPPSSALTP